MAVNQALRRLFAILAAGAAVFFSNGTRSNRIRYRTTVVSLLLLATSIAHAGEPEDASQALSRQVHAYFVGMGSAASGEW